MNIEFFDIDSGETIQNSDGWYFVMSNKVYRDNGRTCESQSSVVGFEDFIAQCPDVGWRIV